MHRFFKPLAEMLVPCGAERPISVMLSLLMETGRVHGSGLPKHFFPPNNRLAGRSGLKL